jgi:predicted metal-dependent phosphoesterase TrpH
MKQLLPSVPKYFRTNLHSHTNITDASKTPEEMKEFYKKRGYDILCISDHNVIIDFSELNEENFLMLTGAEFNVNEEDFQRGNSKSAHFNFIAKRPDNLW